MKDAKREIICRIYQVLQQMEEAGAVQVMKETGTSEWWGQPEELTEKSADYLQGYMDGLAAALMIIEGQKEREKDSE